MSRSIDQRIVEMRFDNREFEAKSKESIATLEALKKSLQLDGATKGLHDLNEAGKRFSLESIAAGVDHIADKFSALDVIAFTVLQNLTNAAINMGKRITGMIFDPLVSGGTQRAKNIQQAKFQFEGLGMDVEATMASALTAVEGTAYGLDEAAIVASQLGASGMRAGEGMTKSLRAVAGVAAMTNSSYGDMGNIFTTVAGNGRLMGQQLLQLSSRGLNAAAAIAEHMGVTEAEVREMVSKGKISFEIFSEAMDGAFGKHAQAANKMFAGSLANLRSAFARIGADVAGPALENLRDVFNAMRPVVNELHKQMKPLLTVIISFMSIATKKWVKTFESMDVSWLGNVFRSIGNVLIALQRVLAPISKAFKQIFPPYTIAQLTAFSEGLEKLTSRFKMGDETSKKLQRTFAGLFAVLDVIGMVLVTVGKAIFGVLETLFPVTRVVLSATAAMGDFAVGLRNAIKSTDILNGLLELFKKVLTPIANLVTNFVTIIVDAFNSLGNMNTGGVDSFMDGLKEKFKPLTSIGNIVSSAFGLMLKALEIVAPMFYNVGVIAADAFKKIQNGVAKMAGDMDIGQIIGAFTATVAGMFVLNMNNVLDALRNFITVSRTPMLNFNKMLYNVRISLMAWQANLQAKVLIKIATAVAVLAAALWVLSTIDANKLAPALAALTGLFANLFGSMAVYQKVSGSGGIMKLSFLSVAMINIAAAILLVAQALKQLAKVDPDRLMTGLSALTGIFTMMTISASMLSKSPGKLIKGSAGIIAFAIAINILADAVTKLSKLDTAELTKGLIGVAVLVTTLAIFLRTANFGSFTAAKAAGLILLAAAINILAKAVKSFGDLSIKQLAKGLGAMGVVLAQLAIFLKLTGNASKVIATATGLVILGAAMNVIAEAIRKMGELSLEVIGKGLGAMAGVLLAITVAMKLLPKNMISASTGLVVVSGALVILAKVLKTMGGMSLEEIGKSLIALAGALTIIAVAMKLMTTALPGALALFVIAGALTILAGVLRTLGEMSLTQIGMGLLALAGIFGILLAAGYLLAPVVPVLLALAAATALFGLAAIGIGVGLTAFAAGLTALAVAGTAGTTALVVMVSALLGLIPLFLVKVGEAIVAFAQVIIDGAPVIVDAILAIVKEMLRAIVEVTPMVMDATWTFLLAILETLVEMQPKVLEAGLDLVLGLLEGIGEKMEDITKAGIEVILAFIRGVNAKLGDIIDTAFKTIISFVNGLADAIRNNGKEIRKAAWNLITALIEGIFGVFSDIAAVGKDVVDQLIQGIKDMASNLWKEGLSVGKNLIDGMTSGVTSVASNLASKAKDAAASAVSGVKKFLGIRSPSTLFTGLGVDTIQGMVNGIVSMGKSVGKAGTNVGRTAVDSMKNALSSVGDILDADMDTNPVITPLLDLDDLKKESKSIGGLFGQPTLTPAYATTSAGMVSSRYTASNEARLAKNAVGGDSTTYNVTLDGVYHIREEADIRKLSQELAIEIERKRRA